MRPSPNPQLTLIALLVQKCGERIPGGYEVLITPLDQTSMSPHGTLQEVPDIDGRGVRLRYFPNDPKDVIDLKPDDWKVAAPETSIVVREEPCGSKSTNPHSTRTCNLPKGHAGNHGDHDGYDLLESWDG